VTDVTDLLARASSVTVPISTKPDQQNSPRAKEVSYILLPLSRVLPHSLTILELISFWLMMLASVCVVRTWNPLLAGEPVVP